MILCFVCDVGCKIGAVNIQMKNLANSIADHMQEFSMNLFAKEVETDNAAQVYDPMKDPNKMNVVY